ncbi:MAG: benzoyl-CoA reductase subunit C [Planctomycetes bacterium]|nr:benzoyl-CoA reductase subunit C [Planctomycetota bacterium]
MAGPLGDCEARLARARALVEDRRLDTVRAWKAGHPGGLAIGHMPVYVPRPMLEAQGCLAVALFGGGDQVDIIRGDSYFQSYICHIPRSTIELALTGDLEPLDGVLFPSICDVIRNLGGMWKLLFPDRYSDYLDLPQDFDPEVGGAFYVRELGRIAGELERRGARPLEPGALREAIARENRRRAALEAMDALRAREPWRVRASEAYLIARAGAALPAQEHATLLEEFLAAAALREVRYRDNVRVVLVGAFCEQPPFELVLTLERAGCDIIHDDLQLGLRAIDGEIRVPEGADPLEALARAYLEQGTAMASRYIGEGEKGVALVRRVCDAAADGVVFAAASFCDPALLDQPMLERALEGAGIPFTSFKFAENTGQFQVIREQAGAFSDAVKLWGKES